MRLNLNAEEKKLECEKLLWYKVLLLLIERLTLRNMNF